MTTCIDPRAIAERHRLRLAHDPAYHAEHGERGRTDDPWLLTIPRRYGHVYPHSDKLLGVATNIRGNVAHAIAAIPCVAVVQDADDGINATFPPELFGQVAALVKPRRKRQLSPEQRAAAKERLARYAFSPARQSDETPQIPATTA